MLESVTFRTSKDPFTGLIRKQVFGFSDRNWPKSLTVASAAKALDKGKSRIRSKLRGKRFGGDFMEPPSGKMSRKSIVAVTPRPRSNNDTEAAVGPRKQNLRVLTDSYSSRALLPSYHS
jgi:hypothetical protein